jgi:hypothetical protein
MNLVAINKIRFRIYQRDEFNSHLTFLSLFKWVLEGHRHDYLSCFLNNSLRMSLRKYYLP